MMKWIKRIALAATGLVVLLLLGALSYEQVSRWNAARQFPPTGALFDVSGASSHLHCSGQGSPTVILESGLDTGGSMSWESVRPQIAELSRVCSYDRAGIMWSDPRPGPRDAEHIVSELHALLGAASEAPPYILVGHSLGGPLVRVFTHDFPDEVSGLVLVDSSHPEQSDRFPEEMQELQPIPPAWLIKTMSTLGVIRATSSPPRAPLPQSALDAMAAHAPTSIVGAVGEMQAIDQLFAQAAGTGNLGDRPLVVLSAGRSPDGLPPGMTPELDKQMRTIWDELQRELASLSTNSDHRVMVDATHYVHWDDPVAVIAAVADVLAAVRKGIALSEIKRTSG